MSKAGHAVEAAAPSPDPDGARRARNGEKTAAFKTVCCYPALMSAEFATPADIPAIMEIERAPGFEDFVGRWSHEQHAAELAKDSTRYFVLRDGGTVKGFAIFQHIGDPDRRVHLKRIVVTDTGRGSGSRLLCSALDWLYTETETNRVDLDLFVENERARRAYEKAGFIVEGRLREYHRSVDGRLRDALIMSILRKDWARRHRL
jgi:RimJ/RimL family protein N-acetyltransferase